jgi:hypothetical protein
MQVLHLPQKFEHPTITIFKSFVKEYDGSNETCTYVYISLYQTSCLSDMVHELSP